MMKTMVVLGFVGAMVAASATPTLARDRHVGGTYGAYAAPVAPYRAYAADPFMSEPRGFRYGRGWGYDAPRATSRPSESWDPYGMRWDGTAE
jgi:uncharacterized membrane protein